VKSAGRKFWLLTSFQYKVKICSNYKIAESKKKISQRAKISQSGHPEWKTRIVTTRIFIVLLQKTAEPMIWLEGASCTAPAVLPDGLFSKQKKTIWIHFRRSCTGR
jgi:hypothetical protein